MQHIPYQSYEDFERGRREMEAFTNEKHVWPDLTLTGEDIHNAYCIAMPDEARPWDAISLVAQQKYEAMAKELNRELDGRQAWFEGEDKPITAIKCPSCGAMISDLKGHPCL